MLALKQPKLELTLLRKWIVALK